MTNFDSTRFGRYAKLDLTINKSFYRNLALVLFATIVGVAVISVLLRWIPYSLEANSYVYNGLFVTACTMVCILSYAFPIMAGCLHHPMRNKQGRITHLTLPATNLEKYLWHTLICIGGCLVVSVLSVAVADLVNFLLSWMLFKSTDGIHSLFVHVFTDQYLMSGLDGVNLFEASSHASMNGEAFDPTYQPEPDHVLVNIVRSLYVFAWAEVLFVSSLYAIGNALRYKFNIPITYVILQFASFVIAILTIIFMVNMGDYMADSTPEQVRAFIEQLHIDIFVFAGVLVVCSIAIWVWAYKIYTKSQITNILNK